MSFHQRLVFWPGQFSHTECYPWVIGKHCGLGMHHNPLIVVELALAAWGKLAETNMPAFGPERTQCNIGPLHHSFGPHWLHMRTTMEEELKVALQAGHASQDWTSYLNSWACHVKHGETAATAPPTRAQAEARQAEAREPPRPSQAEAGAPPRTPEKRSDVAATPASATALKLLGQLKQLFPGSDAATLAIQVSILRRQKEKDQNDAARG